MSKVLLK